MRKIFAFLFLTSLCFLFVACSATRTRFEFAPHIGNRTDAVVDIFEITRSTTEIPEDVEVTAPKYFEVVATSTTAPVTTRKPPVVTEAPKEYYTVKFVDIDGYSAISVQNVEEGKSAKEPPMPERRDDMIFIGWDKDFSSVKGSMIIKAVYQKEWLNVYFYDSDTKLLKTQTVLYGDDATPPTVTPPEGYTLQGWSKPYKNVTADVYTFAKYSKIDEKVYTTLKDAFNFLPVTTNVGGLSNAVYSRKNHNGVCTIEGEDYGGNIIYGNFCDIIDISGYSFKSFEGMVGLKTSLPDMGFSMILDIYFNDKLVFHGDLDSPDTKKEFSLDLAGVDTVKLHLQTLKNGAPYYKDVMFIGGIIDAIFCEN